jgi:DNA-binding NarL/FixJ family response regulator
LLERLDQSHYNLIVLVSTGLDEPFHLSTPFVHAQQVVDGWIAALVMGNCELGLVYSLPDQHRGLVYGAMLQNARAAAAMGEGAHLDDVVQRLANADLILMHSISHTEAMAQRMSLLTGKPVVTARRIVAGAIRLRLAELVEKAGRLQTTDTAFAEQSISDYLPNDGSVLTSREREVLAVLLEGLGNKEIGRRLGISHRTVEIHRSRVFAKLNAASLPDLIRKVLLTRSG